MAKATGDRRYTDLIVQAADQYQPAAGDHTEDMFMAGVILGRAYSLTGQGRYVDLLTKFLTDSRIQQDSGLFCHCRSVPYFWGRGNGFAALGLTETRTFLPEDHSARSAILEMYRRLPIGLREVQQPSGMVLQVMDFAGSYREFTATCMIGYALARGLQRGLAGLLIPAVCEAGMARGNRAH